MIPKVLAYIPNPDDATAFYRVFPFIKLSREDKINMRRLKDGESTFELRLVDYFFSQRPVTNEEISMLEAAKKKKTKIILDYDDDLLNVPSEHLVDFYKKEETKNNVKIALEIADIVIVSTEALKKSYEKFNKNIVVINNSIEPEFQDINKNFDKILWRGSITHLPNLYYYKEEIQRFIDYGNKFKIKTLFFGMFPFYLTNFHYQPFVDLSSYHSMMKNAPGVAYSFVCLNNNQFNKAKSNIAALEAIQNGIIPIVPNWEEWKDFELKYNSKQEFYEIVKAAIDGEFNRKEIHERNKQVVRDKYSLNLDSRLNLFK